MWTKTLSTYGLFETEPKKLTKEEVVNQINRLFELGFKIYNEGLHKVIAHKGTSEWNEVLYIYESEVNR